jgi:hypothetical protein
VQKRGIWESTETGQSSDWGFDEWFPKTIDTDLEQELIFHLIERLSAPP